VQFEEHKGNDAGYDKIAVLDIVAVVDGFDDEDHAGCGGSYGAGDALVEGAGEIRGDVP
jgi:hypothetical protein